MKRLLVVLAACGSSSSPPPPQPDPAPASPPVTENRKPPDAVDRAFLLLGQLPNAPETELINAQCRICHSVDYLTQQRLSEAAWKKTIEKMKKFGAQLDDAQVSSLASFAAKLWNPQLPGRTWKVVPPPKGALPD